MFNFYRAIFLRSYINNSGHGKCAEEKKGKKREKKENSCPVPGVK